MADHPSSTGHLLADHSALLQKIALSFEEALDNPPAKQSGVIITGPTGAGKTYLVEQFVQSQQHCFTSFTIRQSQQHVNIPYGGFKTSIADFLQKVYKEMDAARFSDFSFQLRTKLGVHFPLLFDYIPELALLAEKDINYPASPTPKVENQLFRLFSILFEFLGDFFQKPLLLFTDNLQWMDGSSINLLQYLLIHVPHHKLRWIGTCRNAKQDLQNLAQLTDSLRYDEHQIEWISLKGLGMAQTARFLEEMLHHRVEKDLAAIFLQVCDGNPSYMTVMAESLKSSELIRLENGIWKGDLDRINQLYRGENVHRVLWLQLEKLPSATMAMLSWMACLGTFRKDIILAAFDGNEVELENNIKEALEAGLIERQGSLYRFSETHIGEVIYEGIPSSQKSFIHFSIGQKLLSRGLDSLSNTDKVITAQHLNQALDLVKANKDTLRCAKLNLEVGKLQRNDLAYEQARHFLKISTDLCLGFPWENIKDHFWEATMERAKVEYQMGEYDLAEIHLDHLLEKLLDLDKRAETFIFKITINNHLGRYRKAYTILREVLAELGLELPSEEAILDEITSLKNHLTTDNPGATGPFHGTAQVTQQAILRLLYVGGIALHHTSDRLMVWAALQIILRSKDSKEEGVRAIGYVSYGRMSIIAGEIDQGYLLGQDGLAINRELGDQYYRCRVLGVFAFYIQPWKKHFSESTPLLQEGMEAGRNSGDLTGLYILKTHLFNLHFISGRPIRPLLDYTFEEAYPGMELTYYITHYQKSLIRYLSGESGYFSIPRQQPRWLAAKLTIQEERFYRNYVWAIFYFLHGHYHAATRCAEDANENRKLQEGSPLVPANLTTWHLSITQNWHNLGAEKQAYFAPILQDIIRQVELWSKHAPANYAAAHNLLLAESLRIGKAPASQVLHHFELAISLSGKQDLYTSGLAHELLGKFLLGESAMEKGMHHLEAAITTYQNWGAKTKADQLRLHYSFLFKEQSTTQEPSIEPLLRELSGDLEPNSLIHKLMVMLLRVTGSTRVGIAWIENNGDVIDQVQQFLLPTHAHKNHPLPSGMMLMCHRSQSTHIVNYPEEEKVFSEVNTLAEGGMKSFAILPININGYLSMVIYLENSFAEGHYSEQVLKWARIIANQGGMIIENARIHEKSLLLNQEIRKEMDEKERLAQLIEKQKNVHLQDLIQTQEDERKRIAGDLHDSLGSLLSTIKMQLTRLQEDVPSEDRNTRHKDTLAKMDEAIEEVRRIAHNMSPVSLHRFGLPSALQTLVEQINAGGQMEAELQVLGMEQRLPEQMELTIYRICQELIQNTIKHAQASTFYLQMINHGDTINITVEDNGIGMNPKKIASGFGLFGIEAKVQLLKGQFTIESQPGKGFLAVVDIPL